MSRVMVWVKRNHSWGCSDCPWIFASSGPPHGDTIAEMAENFVKRRDREFKSHVCMKRLRSPAQTDRPPKNTAQFRSGIS